MLPLAWELISVLMARYCLVCRKNSVGRRAGSIGSFLFFYLFIKILKRKRTIELELGEWSEVMTMAERQSRRKVVYCICFLDVSQLCLQGVAEMWLFHWQVDVEGYTTESNSFGPVIVAVSSIYFVKKGCSSLLTLQVS